MSKTVADLEDFVSVFVADAPSVVIQHALREGIVRFMRESQIFQDELELPTECKVRDYPLLLPECRQLVSVESVEFGHGCRENPAFVTGAKFWEWHRDSMEDVVVLSYAPRGDSKLYIKYAWAISRDDCPLPRHLYEQWMEAVKHAALAELFAMPKQEWTDHQLAARSEHYYSIELIKAKNRRWSNYSRGPLKMMGTPFLSRR